jgi:hypothetical protein
VQGDSQRTAQCNSRCLRLALGKDCEQEFKTKFEGRIWSAAKAKNHADYEKAMNYIRSKKFKNQAIGQAAYEYILQSNPSTWATVHFPNPRFSVVISNSAESMNSTYAEFRNGSYLNAFIRLLTKYRGSCSKDAKSMKRSPTLLHRVCIGCTERMSMLEECTP